MAGNYNPNRDIEIVDQPQDSVTSLKWSPKANFLAASAWDNKVRVWQVENNGHNKPVTATTLEAPLLDCCWTGDGTRIFTAGCDNKAFCWTLENNSTQQVAQHDAPIKSVSYIDELNMLVTGSWDKTLRYWDCRSPTAVHTQDCRERIYCMDVRYPLLVLGTAERKYQIYDLRQPQVLFREEDSPLKFQTRCISAFRDSSGFALGSIEGRVAIVGVENRVNDFAFKCHRQNDQIYAINSIAFHPWGTFATAGSDGEYSFWDKDSKQRLKSFQRCNGPISCSSFNTEGSIYAYAVSYDWSKGYEYYEQHRNNYILLHGVEESEIKPRKK